MPHYNHGLKNDVEMPEPYDKEDLVLLPKHFVNDLIYSIKNPQHTTFTRGRLHSYYVRVLENFVERES